MEREGKRRSGEGGEEGECRGGKEGKWRGRGRG